MHEMLGFFKKDRGAVEFTISNHTVIRVTLLVILLFIALSAVQKITHALLLIFTAFFLSLALNEPVRWLTNRLPGKLRGRRALATSISFFVVVALLVGFIASIVPPLVRQTGNFISDAPNIVENLRDDDSSLGNFVRRHNLEGQVDKFSSQLGDRLENFSGTAVSTFGRITSSVFAVLTVLVLTFMMLVEGPRWIGIARRLTPKEHQPHAERLARDMYRVVKGYVNGQVLLAAMAALIVVIPLFILDVSYPIALMVIVFICGLIPLVGHTIGAIIVSTVALFNSPLTALIILIYYIVYQQLENYIVQPRIQANTTDMSPLLVFSAVIIGVSFNGLFGGLVAIPVAGCLRVFVVDYIRRHQLLEPEAVPKPTPETK